MPSLLLLLFCLVASLGFGPCTTRVDDIGEGRKRASGDDPEPLCGAAIYERLASTCKEAMRGGELYKDAKRGRLPLERITVSFFVMQDHDPANFAPTLARSDVDELVAEAQRILNATGASFLLVPILYDAVLQPAALGRTLTIGGDGKFWTWLEQNRGDAMSRAMLNVLVHPSTEDVGHYAHFPLMTPPGRISLAPQMTVRRYGAAPEEAQQIMPTTALARVFLHEMGHAFGLYHTFQRHGCGCATPRGANVDDWWRGDLVGDTSAAPQPYEDEHTLKLGSSKTRCRRRDGVKWDLETTCCDAADAPCDVDYRGYQPWNIMSYAFVYCDAESHDDARLTVGQIARAHCFYRRVVRHLGDGSGAASDAATVREARGDVPAARVGGVIGAPLPLSLAAAAAAHYDAAYLVPAWLPLANVSAAQLEPWRVEWRPQTARVDTLAFVAASAPVPKDTYRVALRRADAPATAAAGDAFAWSTLVTLYPAMCVADNATGVLGVCRAESTCFASRNRVWYGGNDACAAIDASLGCCTHLVDASAYAMDDVADDGALPPLVLIEGIPFYGAPLSLRVYVDSDSNGSFTNVTRVLFGNDATGATDAELDFEPLAAADAGDRWLAARVVMPALALAGGASAARFRVRLAAAAADDAPLDVDSALVSAFDAPCADADGNAGTCVRSGAVDGAPADACDAFVATDDSCVRHLSGYFSGYFRCCLSRFGADGNYRAGAAGAAAASDGDDRDWLVIGVIGLGAFCLLLACAAALLLVVCVVARRRRQSNNRRAARSVTRSLSRSLQRTRSSTLQRSRSRYMMNPLY